MTKYDDIVSSVFPSLNYKAFKLLALYTYMDETGSGFSMNSAASALGLHGEDKTRGDRLLVEKGYITPNGDVNPNCFFKTVFLVKEHFPDLEKALEARKLFRYETAKYLWDVADCFQRRDFTTAREMKRPSNCSRYGFNMERYISPIIFDEGMDKAAVILTDDEFRDLFAWILLGALWHDRITEGLLSKLKDILDKSCRSAADDFLYDHISAYRFFAFGAEGGFVKHGEDTMWSLACEGISYLFNGDLVNARQKFGLALLEKGANRVHPNESSFRDPILSFYYGLCLYKSVSSPEGSGVKSFQYALACFRSSGEIKFNNLQMPITIVLTYADSALTDCRDMVSSDVEHMLQKDSSPYCVSMAHLLLHFFDVTDDNGDVNCSLPMAKAPNTAILRYELSPYIMLGFEEKDRLKSAFGGRPVLHSIRRHEGWETMLQDIRSNILSASGGDRRLAYFLEGNWLKEIMEQRRLPDGEWAMGRPIPRNQFIHGKYMGSGVDMKVADAILRKAPDVSDAAAILPLLSGSDRIFVGSPYENPLRPAYVEQVRPYIEFKARGNRIEVNSNIDPPGYGASLKKCFIKRLEGDTYTIVNLTDLQHEFLSRILTVDSLPVSALPQLKMLEEKLSSILEVRSDLAPIESMPHITGTDIIAVRITPDDGDYNVFLQSCPVPDGQLRFAPGEGDEEIFDEENGITKYVTRDLRAEFFTYNNLKKEIESCGVEFSDYQNVTLSNPESLLKLLTYTHDNPEHFILEWPEGQPLKFRGMLNPSDIDIQVVSNVKWFDMVGKVALGSGSYMSIQDLLRRFREDGQSEYIRVGDNEYMKMSRELRRHLAQLEALTTGTIHGRGNLVVPQYRVGHLAEVLGENGGMNAQMDEGFTSLLDRMKAAYSMTPDVPEGLNAVLRPYQKEGYDWLVRLASWGAGACLADDMGLGKTLQTIAFMLSRADRGPSLVVAPKSVAPNWRNECLRFAPSLNPIILNDQKDKGDTLSKVQAGDVVITTYGMLVTQEAKLSKVAWNVACLDEAHQIKNRNTRGSAAAMNLVAESRVILTGTPIQNHLGELWNLFQFINPGLLGPWQEFLDKYIRTDMDSSTRDNLKALTTPFILRRTKEEVLDDLPEKIGYTHMVQLTDEEMLIYEKARSDAEEMFDGERKKGKDKEKIKINFFEMLTRLRLIANSVSLAYPEWKRQSSKIGALLDILESITPLPDNRILVFSQFTSFLDQVKLALDKMGMDYLYLDGQTSLSERESLVNRFQNGECQIFLISLKAGGLGLNLTAANYVILMDPWWNPAIENQATDRAHRLGQERAVTVIRLVAAQTIEEKIMKLHETKKDLADRMLEGTAESFRLSMDDILDLVSPYR